MAAAISRATPSPAELCDAVRCALSSPAYRPPVLPSVALEVMALAGRPDVELGTIVHLLERDPVLAGRVLALAQSARYARRSPVVTLKQAAVRLGLETLGHLVLEAALALHIFRAPGFEQLAARVNLHATAAAHVTRDVCRRAGLPTDRAFTVGLLHDIGLSSCLLLITERPEWRRLPFSALAPVLDTVHAYASGLLAERWKLLEPIPAVLADHHSAVVDGKPDPLHAALIVAEQLCWEAGGGIHDPPPDAMPTSTDLQEQPLDALDATDVREVREALRIVGLRADHLLAARVHAFDVVGSLIGAS